jgi:hypothetical protein
MKKYSTILSALILGASIFFTGCGDSDSASNTNSIDIESDGKTLIFYSASTNDHVAYNVDEAEIENLNSSDDSELANFNMDESDSGKLFIWIDNKGDDNASNDEEKVVMFRQDYSYTQDGNATWEDFYYLGHYHAEEEDGEMHYHLAAHTNDEFDLSNVPEADLATNAKFLALKRLNTYLAEQNTIEINMQNTLNALNTPVTLCGFKSISNDNGTRNYALGANGRLYIFNNELNSSTNTYGYIDETLVTSNGCEQNKLGISSVSHHDEDGVVVFLESTQKVYLVDSHDGGVYHVHTTYDLSEVIGNGKSAEMMVSLIPVGYDADEEEHEH